MASSSVSASAYVPPPPLTDDGNDDEEEGSFTVPARGTFERVGAPPLALTRICDLTAHQGKLYSAHANQPLGTDGATINVYDPSTSFAVGFDWNRRGEPTKGGGAGQGFLRVHRVAGSAAGVTAREVAEPAGADPTTRARLFVPDADPPYGGLGMVDWGAEGFVFVSDFDGKFARARMPKHMAPLPPTREGKAGALVLPRAYHVLDTIRWRGAMWASTGSVPPNAQAWRGPSPGALHRINEHYTRMVYAVDYPNPYRDGVWRLTYMVRYRGKLLAGIQDYDGLDPNDYVEIDCPSCESADATPSIDGASTLTVRPKRVTTAGTAQTLRWYADRRGRLYWIARNAEGTLLRVTDDGERWQVIDLPAEAGRPTDVMQVGERLLVLAEAGLFAADARDPSFTQVAPAPTVNVKGKRGVEERSLFAQDDWFCAAPMAVLGDTLYAGTQRGGALVRLVPAP